MNRFILGMALVMVLAPIGAWAKIGGGDIKFRLQGTDDVTFSHDLHASGKGIKCRECHYKLYTTVEGHKKSTMAEMEKGESCGLCHNGMQAFAVKTNCIKCHTR